MILQVQFENTHYQMFDDTKKTSGTTYEWNDASAHDLALLAAKLGPSFDTVPPAGSPVKA